MEQYGENRRNMPKQGSIFRVGGQRKKPWVLKHPQDSVARRYFRTKGEAEAFGDNLESGVASFGISFRALTPEETTAFFRLEKLCKEKGMTLIEAVQRGLDSYIEPSKFSMEELMGMFLRDAKASGVRGATIKNYSYICGVFAKKFPGKEGAAAPGKAVREWVESMEKTPSMQESALRVCRVFWNWCMANSHETVIVRDIFAETKLRTVKRDKRVRYLSLPQVGGLIAASKEIPGAVNPVALGLFAGVRPEEVERLPAKAIKGRDGLIRIESDVSKPRSGRTIEDLPGAIWRHLDMGLLKDKAKAGERVCPNASDLVSKCRLLADLNALLADSKYSDGERAKALAGRASLWVSIGKFEKAVEDLRALVEISPEYGGTSLKGERAFAAVRRWERAMEKGRVLLEREGKAIAMAARAAVRSAGKIEKKKGNCFVLGLIGDWPHDALRHTFITYYVALTRDFPRVQAAAGHATIKMIRESYDGVETKKNAQAFFRA